MHRWLLFVGRLARRALIFIVHLDVFSSGRPLMILLICLLVVVPFAGLLDWVGKVVLDRYVSDFLAFDVIGFGGSRLIIGVALALIVI